MTYLREDGLISRRIDTASHAVELHYEAGAEYSIDEITAYAIELTEGRCREIRIFKDGKLVRHLERDPAHLGALGPRHQESWLDIAGCLGNE
jgi:hypothetical protein